MKQLSFFEAQSLDNEHKKEKTYNHWQLFVDGAARNNPGPAGAGIYILKNDKTVKKSGFYLGKKTNNQAEYGALLIGLFYVTKSMEPDDHVAILSDSQLLVRQFNGEYKIKHPELKPLHVLARHLLKDIPYSITHIMREKNSIADEMANKGIDEKKALPQEFITLLKEHAVTW